MNPNTTSGPTWTIIPGYNRDLLEFQELAAKIRGRLKANDITHQDIKDAIKWARRQRR